MLVLLSGRFQFERFSQCIRSGAWSPSGSMHIDLIRSLLAMRKNADAPAETGVVNSSCAAAGSGRRAGLVGCLSSCPGLRSAAERAAVAGEAFADRRVSQRYGRT